MKRKLSAIIALVLAVVMVFPTAVFVGAEDPQPAVIEKMTMSLGGKALANNGSVSLAVDEEITIVIDTDADTVECSIADSAVATVTKSGKSFTFKGRYADNTTSVTFTATKAGPEGTEPARNTCTVNLTCTAPVIDKDAAGRNMITVSYDGGNGDDSLNPGATVSGAKVTITLDNGKTFTDDNARVNTVNDFGDRTADYSTVKVKGGEDTLYFQYTISTKYGEYTGVVSKKIYVLGKAIEYIEINPVSYKSFLYTDSGVDFDDIIVTAYYQDNGTDVLTDYELHGIYNATSEAAAIRMAKENGRRAADFTDMLQNEQIFIVVEYDGVFAAMNANELDFSNPVPYRVEVAELMNSAKKEYVDGQTFGEFGYNGVVIRIYYEGMESGEERVAGGGYIEYIHDKGIPDQGVPGVEDIRGVLEFDPFVYGDNKVKFTYTENDTEIDGEFRCSDLGITIEKKQVTSLSIANTSNVKVKYTEGEKLDLDNLTLTVTYNNGKKEEISYADPNCTCNPKHDAELTKDIDSVLFVYTYIDPETRQEHSVKASLPITVAAKAAESKAIKEVKLLSSAAAKREYFIGEAFDPEGFEFLIVYSDASTDVKDLYDYRTSLNVDSNKYNNTSDQFTASMDGDLKVTFVISYNGKRYNTTMTIPDITVTKRPVLESITASTAKVEYMEGDAPRVMDFVITAKYDDKSQRVFEVDETVTGAARTTYTTTIGGVTYTVKLTPTSIDSETTEIRVAYSERVSGATTVTKYDDVEIEVTIPDAVLTYYDTTGRTYVTEAYEDLYDALERAEEIAGDYTTTYSSRIPEIELRRDVTMVSDFPSTESINIDLNGHILTMNRGEIYVSSRAGSTVEIEFSNSSRTDAKLMYTNDEEDAIILAYNDTLVIDRDTSDAGKYEVVISAVKNGKVTGPDEVTHGHDAQFTITPDEDYEIGSIKVNGKSQSIPADGKLIVEDVQAKVTVTVTFAEKAWENPFTDIYKSATYYKSVQFVYENGLFNGTSATKFEPDTTMTRAMFVTVLGRLAGVNVDNYKTTSFTDVPTGEWYSEYVEWASSIGLVEGYGNGKFGPNDAITHAQMYVLMQRYALLIERLNTNATGANIAANDTRDIPDWAYEAVEYAAKNSFLVTSSNRLTPNANAKRSELAMLLDKFCTNVLDY
ncbi:MAG: S-layer homology domain-containing protein [Clostridia bacterium]|nr:S-layer homology domain-containing protein [Clostridia bacterium]